MDHARLGRAGYRYDAELDKYNIDEMAADYLYVGDAIPELDMPGALKVLVNGGPWAEIGEKRDLYYPFFQDVKAFLSSEAQPPRCQFPSDPC